MTGRRARRTKLCRGPCGLELPLKRFSRHRSTQNGRWYPVSECNECRAQRHRLKLGKTAPRYRYVSESERETYQQLRADGCSILGIARRCKRDVKTVRKWLERDDRFNAPWGTNPGEMVITRSRPGECLHL